MNDHEQSQQHDAGRTVARCVFVASLGIVAYLLVLEHRAHLDGLLGYLPYLFLLACPLMHMFMHRGHDHRGGGRSTDANDRSSPR